MPMHFVEISPGVLELHTTPRRPRKPVFNSMPQVRRVLSHVLNQGEQYHVSEIILRVNESDAGKRLHPAFRGANAQKLLDRLVRHKKIIRPTDAPDYYTLPPRKE